MHDAVIALKPLYLQQVIELIEEKLLVLNRFLSYFVLLISSLLLFGCAQQVTPTGGPKDKTPPKIIGSEPENFSTNFAGNSIKLEFDEFIQQNNISSEMLISPIFDKQPEVKFKSRSVELIFKDTLQPNTTYTINFGKGIVDLNEKNPLDSNLFVFSTGDYLDSLSIEGTVQNAFDLKPAEDILVMLYDEITDSIPYKKKPTYFGRTGKNGSFHIGYIKNGQYKAFALKDANSNYLFDLPDEPIAFVEEIIEPEKTDTVDFYLFEEDVEQQYLVKSYAEHYGKLMFLYNRPTKDARAVPINHSFKKAWYIEELFKNKDTLCYWLTGTEGIDTLILQLWDNSEILDTVEIAIPAKGEKPKIKSRSGKTEFKLTTRTNLAKGTSLDIFRNLRIKFSHPIKSVDASKIIFTEANDTVSFETELDNPVRRTFSFIYEWKEKTAYTVFIPPGAFTDIFDLKNDSIYLNFTTLSIEDYGKLELTVLIPARQAGMADTAHYIVQLMTTKEVVIRENSIKGNAVIDYKNLQPQHYKIKLIYDANGNGKWDTGDYSEKKQPEKVIYNSGKLQIRANWDLDLKWKVE